MIDHAVVGPAGVELVGDADAVRPWASVSKVLLSMAVWVAVEEGSLSLDQAAGPPGSTLRHLLAHASGLAFDSDAVLARPGTRRIYSNTGIELAAGVLEAATEMRWETYVRDAVCQPLDMDGVVLEGSPAADLCGPLRDLARLTAELRAPTLIDAATASLARSVAFPGLDGVLPGYGRQAPNDWGLGVEVRGTKSPHWTPPDASPRTFGHFGRSGSFLWVDPDAGVGLCSLSDRPFGDWAMEAWPALGSEVLARARPG